MNYKLLEYSDSLDLTDFYCNAEKRGFFNNSNKSMLVDSFRNENKSKVWILYYNEQAVGSVAAHSLEIFDEPSFRICARTCVFTDLLPFKHLRTLKYTVLQHQNITAQFFIPKCIEYADHKSTLYITSNESSIASQNQVHKIYCPALEKIGTLTKVGDIFYRGHLQTFWKLNVDIFLQQLSQVNKWC